MCGDKERPQPGIVRCICYMPGDSCVDCERVKEWTASQVINGLCGWCSTRKKSKELVELRSRSRTSKDL